MIPKDGIFSVNKISPKHDSADFGGNKWMMHKKRNLFPNVFNLAR